MVDGEIGLEDVTFAYPARPGRLVFKNFTLNIPAGEKKSISPGKSEAVANRSVEIRIRTQSL